LTDFKTFPADFPLPDYIRAHVAKGENIYTWDKFSERFGYNTLEPIKNKEMAFNYIRKYVTKQILTVSSDFVKQEKNLYLCSHGLKRAEILAQGSFLGTIASLMRFWELGGHTDFNPIDTKLDNLIADNVAVNNYRLPWVGAPAGRGA
jgi:hypothetical protein